MLHSDKTLKYLLITPSFILLISTETVADLPDTGLVIEIRKSVTTDHIDERKLVIVIS